MAVTHKKIAQAAGVSQSTVSKVLSDNPEISEETAAHVRRIAGELGYFDEKLEQRRKAGGYLYPHVAILVPEIVSWYYAQVVTQLQKEIERIGGMAQVYLTDFDETRCRILLEQLEYQQMADCVILIDDVYTPERCSLPLIFRTRENPHTDQYSYITYFWRRGAEKALEHLCQLGHTRIGFIGEINTAMKRDIFRELLAEKNLPQDDLLIYTSHYRFERIGHDGVRAFHIRGNMPTAIVAAYDEVAFGAIQELRDLGYRVPEDVSVVGCNDIPYAVYHNPPLTTVNPKLEEHCAAMIRMLCRMISDPHAPPEVVTVEPELIVRGSTAPCRGKEETKEIQ